MTGTDGRAPAAVPRLDTGGKRDGEAQRRWSWAEPTVWTARMLTTLEAGVKGGRWYSLIEHQVAQCLLCQPWAFQLARRL